MSMAERVAPGLLVRAARIEVHREEDRGHGAEQGAEGAERSSEEDCVERLEEEQARRDAESTAGQEAEVLASCDVLAVAADDRGRRHYPYQAPGGREDLHREDEREERQ